MKYIIRFNAATTNKFFAQADVVREEGGKRSVVETYQKGSFPDTETVIRVMKDTNLKPLINITQEELDVVVPAFGLVDETTNLLIEKADLKQGASYFFNHPDLAFEIKNVGIEIDVESPTETPKEFFWFKNFEAHPDFYIDDGLHERPERWADVRFVVTPVASGVAVDDNSSNVKSFDFARLLVRADRERKCFIADAINVSYDDKSSDIEIEDAIIAEIDADPNRRVYNAEQLSVFVVNTLSLTKEDYNLAVILKDASKKGIIAIRGDQYYYQNNVLGYSLKEAEKTLKKGTFASIKSKIVKEYYALMNETRKPVNEMRKPGRSKDSSEVKVDKDRDE